jgi:hypothetical protein
MNAGVQPGRCAAAHVEDPSPCDSAPDTVVIEDSWIHQATTGCLRHGAVALATLDRYHRAVRLGPGGKQGDAITVYKRAERLPAYAFGDAYDQVIP